MVQYVDKAALVAEIEKRIKSVEKRLKRNNSYSEEGVISWERDKSLYDSYNQFLSFINTLEVKEVDLDYIKNELNKIVKIYKPNGDFGWGTLYNVATHFFELGLNTKKGEISMQHYTTIKQSKKLVE